MFEMLWGKDSCGWRGVVGLVRRCMDDMCCDSRGLKFGILPSHGDKVASGGSDVVLGWAVGECGWRVGCRIEGSDIAGWSGC